MILLGSIIAIGPMSIDLYLPAFPELTRSFDVSESMVQLTLTGFLVGLAIGQLIVGPLSDAVGRRRPLLVGMIAYAVASVLCALAPTIELLAAGRFLQGLVGSTGSVLALALVRDLVDGPMVARVISRLILVIGIAPVLAPTLGGILLPVTGWRGIFVTLAIFGAIMAVVVAVFVKETLPAERRNREGITGSLRSYRTVITDKWYVAYASISVLGFVMIFGYVSGAPFAYQEVYGVSPQVFGFLFGGTAIGMVVASQVNARLVLRIPPLRVLARTVPVTAIAGLVLVLTQTTGAFGIVGLAVPMAVVVGSFGLILPNAGALALNRHPESAGTAASLVGTGQFAIGGFVGPLIGAAGGGTSPVPMAVLIAAAALGLTVLATLLARRDTEAMSTVRLDTDDEASLVH